MIEIVSNTLLCSHVQGDFHSSAMAVLECVYSGLDSHCYRRGAGLCVPGAPIQVCIVIKTQRYVEFCNTLLYIRTYRIAPNFRGQIIS